MTMFITYLAGMKFSTYTDEELIQSALVALNNCYLDCNITRKNVIGYKRSNWSKDENALMSYTFI